MAKIVAVTSCPTGIAHTFMAAESLQQAANRLGHQIKVETQGSVGTQNTLTQADIEQADAVIIAADTKIDLSRFSGKKVFEFSTRNAIQDSAGIIDQALKGNQSSTAAIAQALNIVAITSCPTGVAHTFMAAEGLQQGATQLGHHIKVETQGSVGAQNTLSAQDIEKADLVIIAADTNVDLSRFQGKKLYSTGTKPVIHDSQKVVQTAIVQGQVHGAAAGGASYADTVARNKEQSSQNRTGAYKHLMTGVSFMLPFVVAGGLLIAIAFALGGINVFEEVNKGTLGYNLFQVGARNAFALMVPVLAGYIAFSIADRPGLAPGMVGGMLAVSAGSGFLGGMIAGFLAGYLVQWLNKNIQLPRTLQGLKPTLILPLLGTTLVGLLMIYVIGTPVAAVLNALTEWLKGMSGTNAVLLGLLLGAMMAFDMGGPVNKASYAFATGLLASDIFGPMAAVMVAGMTPPLGLWLATLLFKNRFTTEEQEAGKAAAVLGISFITEGAIPFAARDPLRVIPSLVAGSAVAGAISMMAGCALRVPHGGVFVLPIPNAVTNLPMYVVALLAGTVVTAVLLGMLKKPVTDVNAGEAKPASAAQQKVQG
ncbi:PTS fructose-like transporter subunit IIB [Deinococcus cellulosilyticus]|uniref:PTS fructose transporter subunit IIBC n=1 Tax=Deinococcus cellulosilyticus (strain DSM 18568 / NBRC 106333 / KACC 11606 / 5516J-15) TaxID=1223518 RepID=A0A511N3G5_DEIC1|nr:PTS fructose-like transporter subunit IIB [Deinococcus cellulosilyticus]GEM46931.1 PTS fructose transporter subunit IIBC [Deinococcus cellulosilyticus NBRC 106333 = KACC 11606]